MLTDALPSRFEPVAFDGATLRPMQVLTRDLASERARFEVKHGWSAPRVEISPDTAATRRAVSWDGMAAEVVETTGKARAEYRLKGAVHLLAVCEQGERHAGETFVEGLPRSALRDLTGRITLVPAGREYRERHESRAKTRTIFVYLDPAKAWVSDALTPRLHFQDELLHGLAVRLRTLVEAPSSDDKTYLQALGVVIANELARVDLAGSGLQPLVRGGLATWQERVVAEHIEEHLAEQISLGQLAQLARLSPYHFSRAFKQSFGIPPHRYHVMQRVERAKTLLASSGMSVTEIGLAVGFSETSAFTATFRKLTGVTPSTYGRSVAGPPA